MHKDIECLIFDIDENNNIDRAEIKDNGHLPLLFYINKDDDIKKNLSKWLNKRIIPASRMKYDRLLECLRIDDFEKVRFILENKALSLSDCYWIKKEDSEDTWEKVNYYENPFNQDLVDIYIDSTIIPEYKNMIVLNPSNTLDGYLPKAWVIENDKRLLYKRSSIENRETINEVICSEIYRRLNIDCIKYDYADFKGKECCSCECMCDSNTDYITANYFVQLYKKENETDIECICRKLKEIYATDNKFYEMVQMDFILANTDRHWNNFGFLRDAVTLEYIKYAPIYDNGNSLWYNKSQNKIGTNDVYRMVRDFSLFDIKDKILKDKLVIQKNNIEKVLDVILDTKYSQYEDDRKQKIYNECLRWLDILFE